MILLLYWPCIVQMMYLDFHTIPLLMIKLICNRIVPNSQMNGVLTSCWENINYALSQTKLKAWFVSPWFFRWLSFQVNLLLSVVRMDLGKFKFCDKKGPIKNNSLPECLWQRDLNFSVTNVKLIKKQFIVADFVSQSLLHFSSANPCVFNKCCC